MRHLRLAWAPIIAILFLGAGCPFFQKKPAPTSSVPPVSGTVPINIPEPPEPQAPVSYWTPKPRATFQWQLEGSFDASVEADVYDLDLFDTSPDTIKGLHERGKRLICYVSVGTWEDWRPDKADFPTSLIGKPYSGWEGERWFDIRKLGLLGPLIEKRFDLAKEKGCDAIEPDNIDGYDNDTGFSLTASDQVAFVRWLADQAHLRGMSIGLKNVPALVSELSSHFDWALTEDCHLEGWCQDMKPFAAAGKAVFQVEYTDAGLSLGDFCPAARANSFMAILKKRELDAWRQACP